MLFAHSALRCSLAICASQVLRISAASFGFVYGGVKLGYLKVSAPVEQVVIHNCASCSHCERWVLCPAVKGCQRFQEAASQQ